MKTILSLIFLLLTALQPLHSQTLTTYANHESVPYYDDVQRTADSYLSEKGVMDIHHPIGSESFPVIIWFHGGGLKNGNRKIPQALLNQGYVIVSPSYRLYPRVEAATAILDATAAIAWTLKNIQRYNGNPDKVFVSGHSAGGYLAMMSILDKDRLRTHDLDADKIAGLIPFSGHTITHMTIREERGIPGTQPIIDAFAPLFFVRPDAPPTLLITGDREREMLGRHEENAYFYRMMKVAGHQDIQIFELDGYGHGMTAPAFPLLLNFVKERSQ